MLSYWSFIKQNLRFLSFGLVLVFVGNYGQTFFISVFGGVWREAFDLSHTQYSFYYSLATLISGFALMIIGGKLDTSSLKTFTLWVLTGTLIATLVLAFALNAYWLFAGFLLVKRTTIIKPNPNKTYKIFDIILLNAGIKYKSLLHLLL